MNYSLVFVLLPSLASNVAHNVAARVLFEYAGHFYEQSAIVSDWPTANAFAATHAPQHARSSHDDD